jgi:hypothetical protein
MKGLELSTFLVVTPSYLTRAARLPIVMGPGRVPRREGRTVRRGSWHGDPRRLARGFAVRPDRAERAGHGDFSRPATIDQRLYKALDWGPD